MKRRKKVFLLCAAVSLWSCAAGAPRATAPGDSGPAASGASEVGADAAPPPVEATRSEPHQAATPADSGATTADSGATTADSGATPVDSGAAPSKAVPLVAMWANAFEAYPGAAQLCWKHVHHSSSRSYTEVYGSQDPLQKVRAFYKKRHGVPAESSRWHHDDGPSRSIMDVLTAAAARGSKVCPTKGTGNAKTIIVIRSEVRGEPEPFRELAPLDPLP